MAIKDYYKTLSASEKREFAFAVCMLCDISIAAFQKKIYSRGFRKVEETLIQEKLINKQA
ncbi:MAG: hypothetical protein E7089_08805 [Bacteroidales bacterium]|nr:hypothetical protein [Bacteroidales bacterium]